LGFMEIGFNLHDTMIYRKTSGGIKGSHYVYLQSFEYMFVLSKCRPAAINLISDRKNVASPGTKTERTGRKSNGDFKVEEVTRKEYERLSKKRFSGLESRPVLQIVNNDEKAIKKALKKVQF